MSREARFIPYALLRLSMAATNESGTNASIIKTTPVTTSSGEQISMRW